MLLWLKKMHAFSVSFPTFSPSSLRPLFCPLFMFERFGRLVMEYRVTVDGTREDTMLGAVASTISRLGCSWFTFTFDVYQLVWLRALVEC